MFETKDAYIMANPLECRSKRLTPFADIGAKRGLAVAFEWWPEDEVRGAKGTWEPSASDGTKAKVRVGVDTPHIFDESS